MNSLNRPACLCSDAYTATLPESSDCIGAAQHDDLGPPPPLMANEVNVTDAAERDSSKGLNGAAGAPLFGNRAPRDNTYSPTRGDPAIVMLSDRAFCCWVEPLNDGDRWVFLSPEGAMFVGPNYEREGSLEEIGAMLAQWRVSGGGAERPSP